MSAIPNPQEPAPHLAPEASVFWLCILLLGVGIAGLSVFQDRGDRLLLERAVQRTSVEDKNYFPIGDRELQMPLRFRGAHLVLSAGTPDPMPDSQMIFAGETDEPKFRLYVPVERLNGEPQLGGPSWYLKTAPGQFIRVTR